MISFWICLQAAEVNNPLEMNNFADVHDQIYLPNAQAAGRLLQTLLACNIFIDQLMKEARTGQRKGHLFD